MLPPLKLDGDRVLDGSQAVYWLRRESRVLGVPYIALDYRRADGGVGTIRTFTGPTREADALAALERKSKL